MSENMEWGVFAFNVVLSIVGLLVFSLVKIGKENLKRFDPKIFINANKPFWIWALMLQFLFAFILVIAPDAGPAVKSLSGLDLTENMAFLTSGAGLAGLANIGASSSHNNEIGKK